MGGNTTAEERMEYVKGAGFEFSKQELDNVTSELTDEELDAVAGGSWKSCIKHCDCEHYVF